MKCPFCGGSGVNETWVATDKVSEYKQTCFKCHGKGEWDCTEEEYIRHCTTEELAEVISNIARSCYECGKNPMKNFCYFGHCLLANMGAEVWLKEKKK